MRAVVGVGLGLLMGCQGPTERESIDDVAPLEFNLAPPVEPVDGNAYPEGVMSFLCGEESEPEAYFWCHARAYVAAPIEQVLASTMEPDVVVDRREIDTWDVTGTLVPNTDYSMEIDITLTNIIFVEYTLQYGYDVVEGTLEEPETTWCLFDTVRATSVLKILRGSMVLHEVAPNLTEYQYIEHLKTPLRDTAQVEQTMRDIYADVLAHVHGEPLPSYD